MKKDKVLHCKLIVEYTMKNVINQSDLDKRYKGSMRACIKWMLKEDHISGLVDDDYKILSVEVI